MDTSNRTFVSSVLFLDIVEYSKQSVTDQMALKKRFNELLVDALKHVATGDRIVLDTGDGAAVSFQGNPEDSLFAAMHLRDALAPDGAAGPRLDVRFGINLGPVRLIKDINGQVNIIGDGINVAQRVMSFADPGVILVSRSYYEVVSRLSDDYAKIFQDAGTRTDKHVREHAVYAIGSMPGGASPPLKPAASAPDPVPAAAPARKGPGRKVLLASGIGALLLAALVVGLLTGEKEAIVEAEATAAPGPEKSDTPAPASKKTAKAAAMPAASEGARRSPGGAAAPARATVLLVIKPWGEVYVDGKLRGVSPPLKTLSLPPGTHNIEVRNSTFPAFVKSVDARAGAEIRITHKF